MFRIYGRKTTFWQWDSEQKIVVEDNTINEVHFCHKTDECSLVCEVYECDGLRVADVPNILLQEAKRIYVYAYCENHTKYSEDFVVISRSKPSDYVYTETEVRRFEDLEKRMEIIEKNGVNNEVIAVAVREYLEKYGNESFAKIGEVTLFADNWAGDANLYSQVVSIDGVTKNSQVDLTPSVEQLAVFYEKDLTFVTENYNGVVTVYAIGQKPQNDYTIQVTITEVAYE